jgi:hypothetical protein
VSRVRPTALLALVAVAAVGVAQRRPAALFHGGDAPVVTGPAPSPRSGLDAADCGRCHAAIAAEWRASLHARAWRDPVFQSSYATEPEAFCRNCHAPLIADGAAEPDARAAAEAVSCAVCHVRDGHVLGTGGGRGDAPPSADSHPLAVRPELAASGFCGGCHQFDFPARGRRGVSSGEPMQDTLGEWSRSAAAARGQSCQDCHMPWRADAAGRRYRSHRFPGVDDAAMLRGAVRVTVTAGRSRGATTLHATIAPGEIGHAFPTGDLFRQAELTAWIDGDETTQRVARLTRSYGATATHRRTQSADSRVPPPAPGAAREVTLTLPPLPPGARLRWTFDHLRMPTEHALRQSIAPSLNRARVAEGYITP